MIEKHRPSPTEEVKDAVVRDYLRGDKAILIQMEYDISAGVMYRILKQRCVKLRRPDLAVRRSPEGTPPAPVAAEAPAGGFEAAMKALLAEEGRPEDVLGKVLDSLTEWLPKEPISTMVTIGLSDKSFTPDDVIQAAVEAFVVEMMRSIPRFEEIEPRVWKLKKEGA